MKYYIITIGCFMNQADSERVASFLEVHNYQVANSWLSLSFILVMYYGSCLSNATSSQND